MTRHNYPANRRPKQALSLTPQAMKAAGLIPLNNDLLAALPITLTRSQAVKLATDQRFPPVRRFLGRESTPFVEASALIDWTKAHFADLPGAVSTVEKAVKAATSA